MAAASGEELERALLKALDDAGAAGAAEGAGLDSGVLSTTLPPSTGAGDAERMVGTIKRLESFELVTAQARAVRVRAPRAAADAQPCAARGARALGAQRRRAGVPGQRHAGVAAHQGGARRRHRA